MNTRLPDMQAQRLFLDGTVTLGTVAGARASRGPHPVLTLDELWRRREKVINCCHCIFDRLTRRARMQHRVHFDESRVSL